MLCAKSWRELMLQFVFFVHDKLISISVGRTSLSPCPKPQRTAIKYQPVLWIITQIGVEAGDERSCLRFTTKAATSSAQTKPIYLASLIISPFFGISFSIPALAHSQYINKVFVTSCTIKARDCTCWRKFHLHTAIRSHKICIRIVKWKISASYLVCWTNARVKTEGKVERDDIHVLYLQCMRPRSRTLYLLCKTLQQHEQPCQPPLDLSGVPLRSVQIAPAFYALVSLLPGFFWSNVKHVQIWIYSVAKLYNSGRFGRAEKREHHTNFLRTVWLYFNFLPAARFFL